MAISGVRWEGTVRNRFTHRLGVQGDCPLFLLHALGGFTLPASSFFLALLEKYGLQLHHLTSHVIALVAIFAHFCEM
jgi:hypothetical protein